VNRRATYAPSRSETVRWFLVRVCVVEAVLIVALLIVMTSHPGGIR